MRPSLFLFILGIVIHALWAATISRTEDWDPAYYTEVARHLAAGEGNVTGVIWTLSFVPETLPFSADTHWMPLPSKVLVPGLWVWPEHGAQLTSVLLAATWGPLAWWIARRLGASPRVALMAGVLAATGGPWARSLSTPDSFGLYGLLGGLGIWAVAEKRLSAAIAIGALAALCRNDGFLFAFALAWGFGRTGLWVAGAGMLSTLGWHLRNLSLFGDPYLASRRASSSTLSYADFVAGIPSSPTIDERLAATMSYLPEAPLFWLTATLAVGTPFLAWAAWTLREHREVQVTMLFFLGMPLVVILLAPAIAAHGTVFRSGAAVYPALCALCAIGLSDISRMAVEHRDYPPWFLPVLIGSTFVAGTGLLGAIRMDRKPPPDCTLLAQTTGVIFHWDPLLAAEHCDRQTIMLPRNADPEVLGALVERFEIQYAIPAPQQQVDEGTARMQDALVLLPGWTPVGTRILRRPDLATP